MDYIDKVRIPEKGADIYKDECIYSYDSPVSLIYVFY